MILQKHRSLKDLLCIPPSPLFERKFLKYFLGFVIHCVYEVIHANIFCCFHAKQLVGYNVISMRILQYPDIAQIPFPGKKAFNNMERNVREKRMKMLNDYMRILLQLSVIKSHPGVQNELLTFLEPEYDKGGGSGQLAKTVIVYRYMHNPVMLLCTCINSSHLYIV